MTVSNARTVAVAAYLAAVDSPASADWRSIADALYSAMPATRGRAIASAVDHGDSISSGAAPRWFADWKLGKVYSLDSLAVTFADGVAVRVNLAKAPGKLPRVAHACRVAVAFYRAHTGRDSVPAFASLVTVSDGEGFDAETCSALTADLRVTAIVPRAVRPAVTAEAVERMERELERRRAGLARSEAMPARIAAHFTPFCLAYDSFCASVQQLRAMKESAAMAESWRAAIAAGEAELATMRAAVADAPPPVLSPLAVAAIEAMREPEAAPCDPVAVMPDLAAVPVTVAACEPCEAVNDAGPVSPPPAGPAGAAAIVPLGGTYEQLPDGGIEWRPDAAPLAADAAHLEPFIICPAVGMPCKADCGFRAGCTPRAAVAASDPLDAADDGAPAPHLAGDETPARVVRKPRTPRRAAPKPILASRGRIAPASMAIGFHPTMRATFAPLHSAPTL